MKNLVEILAIVLDLNSFQIRANIVRLHSRELHFLFSRITLYLWEYLFNYI